MPWTRYRFYFSSDVAADVSPTFLYDSASIAGQYPNTTWPRSNVGQPGYPAAVRRKLQATRGSSALATTSVTMERWGTPFQNPTGNYRLWQFVSDPLDYLGPRGTGTVMAFNATAIVAGSHTANDSSNNARPMFWAYFVSAAGSTLRSSSVSGGLAGDTSTEYGLLAAMPTKLYNLPTFATTKGARGQYTALYTAGSPAGYYNSTFFGYVISPGDRLVVEVGYRLALTGSGAAPQTVSMEIGENAGAPLDPANPTAAGFPYVDLYLYSTTDWDGGASGQGARWVKPVAPTISAKRMQYPPVPDRSSDILNEFLLN